LDYPPSRSLPQTKQLDTGALSSQGEELIKMARDHNPQLKMLANRIQRDQEKLELANLGYWPEVTFGFEWNHLDPRKAFIPPANPQTLQRPKVSRKSEVGDDNWALMLQMNIPLWTGRIEAARREARHRLLESQQKQKALHNLVAFRIYDAWSRVQTQQDTIQLLQATLIPQTRQAYEVSLISYQGGTTGFLNLIDNWRRWLDFEMMTHRETADLETAFSDLQREVGLQLVRNAEQ